MAAQAKQVPFNDARWEPLDKAAELKGKVSADGVSLTHTLVGGTDWWRTTERHSTNGPARGFYVDGKRDFEISVDITVHPEVQATIFLYASPKRWIKAGIEYDNDALWNGAVVCNPYSDWSIAKRSPSDSSRYTIAYTGDELKVYLGEDMIREVKWFGPTADDDAGSAAKDKVFVGIMACCPNAGGATVEWSDFTIRDGVRAP